MKKYPIDYGNEDIFKYYIKKTGNPNNLKQKVFFQIFKEYIQYVRQLMIENAFQFTLPYNMGKFRLYKYKVKIKFDENGNLDKRNLRVDWDATKKYWAQLYPGKTMAELKLIDNKPKLYFTNKHTDGFRIRLRWFRGTALFKMKSIYTLKLLRVFSREIAKAVKENPHIDYLTFNADDLNFKNFKYVK